MKPKLFVPLLGIASLLLAPAIQAEALSTKEAKIKNAMSAAPPSIADNATIKDWPAEPGGEMPVLRAGNNGWTCFPDMPDSAGDDPMCLDAPWMAFADAWMNKTPVKNARMGFGYMLHGDASSSNTDPFAQGPTPDNEWMEKGIPHLMILVPDEAMLAELPTDPDNGGPWVMWRNTPYVHIMAPMPRYNVDGK